MSDNLMPPPTRKTVAGEKVFWLLQIIFSLVISKGIFEYRELILNPSLNVQTVAFVGVLITTIWSWLDFTNSSVNSSYDKNNPMDLLRFLFDFLIVLMYAFMLFSVAEIIAHPDSKIIHFLISYPIIFFLYILSGILRIIVSSDKKASSVLLLASFLIVYSLSYFLYLVVYDNYFLEIEQISINTIFVSLFIGIYILYRIANRIAKRKSRKSSSQNQEPYTKITNNVEINIIILNAVKQINQLTSQEKNQNKFE